MREDDDDEHITDRNAQSVHERFQKVVFSGYQIETDLENDAVGSNEREIDAQRLVKTRHVFFQENSSNWTNEAMTRMKTTSSR